MAVVRFGIFDADLATGELRRRGVRVSLQEQPFQVLSALLDRPGDLVTREELRTRIWPSAVFVDFEHGLNKAISKLRRALGDSADNPRFVETLPRRGYRFLAPVAGAPAPVTAPLVVRAGEEGRRRPERAVAQIEWEGGVIRLLDGENLIGRGEEVAVRIDVEGVSRRHARIVVDGGRFTLEDLGSKNGTYLREQRLEGPAALEDGDAFRLGRTAMVFCVARGRGTTITED